MNEQLPALIAEADAIAADAGRAFGHLSRAQLNWKRRAEEWSVAQCFDHLIKINSEYFPRLREIEQGSYSPSWRERLPLLPRLFGSVVLKAVEPRGRRKLKASRHVQPSASSIEGDIIARFTAHQRDVVEHMKKTGRRDLSATVITSPVASIATYSVLDAYKIILAHERRHMAQAQRVVDSEAFPAA